MRFVDRQIVSGDRASIEIQLTRGAEEDLNSRTTRLEVDEGTVIGNTLKKTDSKDEDKIKASSFGTTG